jgi:PhnB protein
MLRLTPFILFDGNCAEAMEFYSACFGGELNITRLADTPMRDHLPPAQHHKVVNAHLKSDAVEFSATDWLHPVHVWKQGDNVAMYLRGDGFDELKAIFDKLRAGANEQFFEELQEMPFGTYGRFTDRFGIEWFFVGGKA